MTGSVDIERALGWQSSLRIAFEPLNDETGKHVLLPQARDSLATMFIPPVIAFTQQLESCQFTEVVVSRRLSVP